MTKLLSLLPPLPRCRHYSPAPGCVVLGMEGGFCACQARALPSEPHSPNSHQPFLHLKISQTLPSLFNLGWPCMKCRRTGLLYPHSRCRRWVVRVLQLCPAHLLTMNPGQVVHKQVLRPRRLPRGGAMVSRCSTLVSLGRTPPGSLPWCASCPGPLLKEILSAHSHLSIPSLHQHRPWQCPWWCHPQWAWCWWHCHGPR